MKLLIGKNITLRALKSSDLDFLFKVENDKQFWSVSNTSAPYSKQLLRDYIRNAQQDIYEAKQYRFVICDSNQLQVGMIDLFDFDPQHKRIGAGILVLPEHQNLGYGSESLELIINYAFSHLNLHQIFANIGAENNISRKLFAKCGFEANGTKKDWQLNKDCYEDELIYQLINPADES